MSNPDSIHITVIVATFNRCESLKNMLQALSTQNYPSSQFEVLVINDGSSDGTRSMLESMQAQVPYILRHFNQPNKGPAAARNTGIRHAKGGIVAFTDDDCLPQPNWLSEVWTSMNQNNWMGVQGSTYTNRPLVTPLTHQIDNTRGNASVPTCNAAYRLAALKAVQGFDEAFPYPHNEDADLAWRIEKLGVIGFNSQMSVYHPPRQDQFWKVAHRMKIMESEFRLFYKDPVMYRTKRSQSPWMTIYYIVGLKTQFYYLRNRIRYFRQPWLMMQGLLLNVCWWADLIKFLPRFLQVNRLNQKQFQRTINP
ncbi:MAG TPA: glycosyltransferase family A protein [Cyclobacteriaceae bacterium]|nr:glycosyltransferase family A protein [Cyclobacteriaceae bacterium]